MEEGNNQAQATAAPAEEGTMGGFDPSKITKAGKSTIGRLDVSGAEQTSQQNNQQQQQASPDAGAAANATAGDNGAAASQGAEVKLPEVNDDQLRQLLEGKGIKFEGDFESLKSKLTTPAAPAPELTAEQKAEAEKNLDTRMLNKWIAEGGKAEDYVALKQIIAADKEQLAQATRLNELIAAGFTAEEAAVIMKERYYKLNPEELVKGEDEDDDTFNKKKELITKKANYGKEKFESRSSIIRKDAEDRLNAIKEAIANEDAEKDAEAKFSSTVEEFSKTVPRKITFELGQVDGKDLAPVVIDVNDSDVDAITDMLKDKAKRKQILYNEDGKLDLSKAFGLLLNNRVLQSAVKASYNEGGNRQVEEIKKVFPGSPFELGVGGNSVKRAEPGKITRAGKPQVVPQNR